MRDNLYYYDVCPQVLAMADHLGGQEPGNQAGSHRGQRFPLRV